MEDLVKAYARKNYMKMLREPDGQLSYKFIVPGSVYRDSLWDWDSWLTDVALHQIVEEDYSEYSKGCILNFLAHLDSAGRIPMMITPTRQLPRTLNEETNGHKPCLAQHAAFIVKQSGEAEWLRPHFGKLLRFVDCYMENNRHDNGLYF